MAIFDKLLPTSVAVAMLAGAPVALAQQASGVAPPVAPLAPQGQSAAAANAPSEADEYIIGPEDVIEIEVVGLPDRTRAKVYTDGTIQTNLLGKVQVSGQTPRQVGEQLAKLFKAGGFYANPVVNVEVVNYASRYVTVLGAVSSPGLVPINRPYRMSEVLARVGGVTGGAAEYLVVRPEQGPEVRYNIKDLSVGDVTKDPFVKAGDKIFAPNAELFYISGQVRQPGSFPLSSDLTVRQAIGRSGGLTETGTEKKVTVTRDGKKVKLSPDDKIQPGDVLVVGERLF
jgi:polysaccharide export outer membrane protein